MIICALFLCVLLPHIKKCFQELFLFASHIEAINIYALNSTCLITVLISVTISAVHEVVFKVKILEKSGNLMFEL